jgi:hypothetical protein
MTAAQKATAADERRRRDLRRATETLQKHQDARIFGTVAFHLQSGRIVRVEVHTSEKLGG